MDSTLRELLRCLSLKTVAPKFPVKNWHRATKNIGYVTDDDDTSYRDGGVATKRIWPVNDVEDNNQLNWPIDHLVASARDIIREELIAEHRHEDVLQSCTKVWLDFCRTCHRRHGYCGTNGARYCAAVLNTSFTRLSMHTCIPWQIVLKYTSTFTSTHFRARVFCTSSFCPIMGSRTQTYNTRF